MFIYIFIFLHKQFVNIGIQYIIRLFHLISSIHVRGW